MKCPVCGNNTFDDKDYEWEICSECFWEYDLIQVKDPTLSGGANRHSLYDYRKMYFRLKKENPRFSCKNKSYRELMVASDHDSEEEIIHRVFGTKEAVRYSDREGAYLIPVRNNSIGVIRTHKGYFFIGGGLENGESHLKCIERECLEETGCLCRVKDKLCSAEAYERHPEIGYFHPIQTYYQGELLDKSAEPVEPNHTLCWIEYEQLKGKMFLEMQNWALEQLILITI